MLHTDDPLAEAEDRLRASLSVITGWATSLGERWDEIPEEARRHGVHVVRAGADRLADELDLMLEEARAELRARDLAVERVDVAALAARASADLAGLAVRHDVTYTGPDSGVALAEEASLRQVLDHLHRDALRRSPAGTSIATAVVEDGDELVLRITAPGTPAARAAHLARTLVVGMGGRATGDGSYTFPCTNRRQFDDR